MPYAMYIPPLTCRVSPVMYAPQSEAKKPTAAAISSGVPKRASGICDMSTSICFSCKARVMSVSMKPGATQFTVMPREPISLARDLEKPSTAALDAA